MHVFFFTKTVQLCIQDLLLPEVHIFHTPGLNFIGVVFFPAKKKVVNSVYSLRGLQTESLQPFSLKEPEINV